MSAVEGAENLGQMYPAAMQLLAPKALKSVAVQAAGRTLTPNLN